MEEIWDNIVHQTETYGPKVFAALLILIGFILAAYFVRWIIKKGVDASGLAKSTNVSTKEGAKSLGASLGSAGFWIIILIGIVQALTRLEMTQVTDPLNSMLDNIFAYMPRVLAAVLIFAVFAIVAGVVNQAVKAVLVFADPMPKKFGLTENDTNISGVTATVLSAIVFVLGGIAAFEALQIKAISEPATAMLNEIVAFIPNAIAAGVILSVFVFIGRFVANLLKRTLPSTGVDAGLRELGLFKGADAGLTATSILSNLALFFIVLVGLIASLRALNLDSVTMAMNVVLDMGASIVFGTVIIFAGVFIANLVTNAMASTGSGATDVAAKVVKWVIVILAVILGISRMGLDPENGNFILDAARILLIGGAAGLALAFGLGGKDWAAEQLKKWKS